MSEYKPIVCVDLDDTCYDFVARLLPPYNTKYNDNLTVDDITDYRIHKFLKPECKHLFREFADKQLFADIIFAEEDKKALAQLNKLCELYFLTAGHPKTIRDRDKMLSRNLDFYRSSQLIVCRNKSMIECDYLVDDCINNIENMVDKTLAHTQGIMMSRPWNNSYTISSPFIFKVNTLTEVVKLITGKGECV